MTMLRALALSLLILAANAATAQASPQTPEDRAFARLLRSIDVIPASRGALERMFKDAHQRLMRAAKDDALGTYERVRAITLLSFFVEPETRVTLEALATRGDQHVRRWSIYTVGRTFGSPGDAALVRLVETVTADPQPEVSHHAVRTLRWIDHAAAGALLERLVGSERKAIARLARLTARKRAKRLAR